MGSQDTNYINVCMDLRVSFRCMHGQKAAQTTPTQKSAHLLNRETFAPVSVPDLRADKFAPGDVAIGVNFLRFFITVVRLALAYFRDFTPVAKTAKDSRSQRFSCLQAGDYLYTIHTTGILMLESPCPWKFACKQPDFPTGIQICMRAHMQRWEAHAMTVFLLSLLQMPQPWNRTKFVRYPGRGSKSSSPWLPTYSQVLVPCQVFLCESNAICQITCTFSCCVNRLCLLQHTRKKRTCCHILAEDESQKRTSSTFSQSQCGQRTKECTPRRGFT